MTGDDHTVRLTDRDIAIYALGKTEGIDSVAQTLGNGLDDEKYIESWNKTMGLLGVKMSLGDLEEIYREFARKIDEVVAVGDADDKGGTGGSGGSGGSGDKKDAGSSRAQP